LENVLLPLIFAETSGKAERALSILKMVGLEKRAKHKPSQLSGGEQQRVAIARALVNNPLLILADEPTGNMDQETGRKILHLFDQLNREGRGIIMVTHNPEIAKYAGEIIVLRDGQVIDRINQRGGDQ
jgi:putative ABC transport system ATP-binding protein